MSAEQLTAMLVTFLAGMVIASIIIAMWLYRRSEKSLMLPGSGLMMTQPKRTFWADFWHGIGTEMVGVIMIAVLFTIILGAADQQQVIDERKRQLVVQMGSPNNGIATEAARQLVALGWFADGTLEGANLFEANLAGATLEYANLTGAFLWGANLVGANLAAANLEGARLQLTNLDGANLGGANLEGAFLREASLDGTNLSGANLKGVNLSKASLLRADLGFANLEGADLWRVNLAGSNLADVNLTGADLSRANLAGASLAEAHLVGANLRRVTFDEKTVLPDAESTGLDENRNPIYTPGSYYQPSVTDMGKYIDPDHPDFWQPERVQQAADRAEAESQPDPTE